MHEMIMQTIIFFIVKALFFSEIPLFKLTAAGTALNHNFDAGPNFHGGTMRKRVSY